MKKENTLKLKERKKERKKENKPLKTRIKITIAGLSAIATLLCGCGNKDTRIDNIDKYYILRVADESGTKNNIVYTIDNRIANHNDWWIDGKIYSYSENYYEKGTYSSLEKFSPIQFIPYTEILEKDTYYKHNVANNTENQAFMAHALETYAFPTHIIYTFGETTYEYQSHVYEIENQLTEEKRFVIGYPLIPEETNPTQIYDALTASFIYIQTNELATTIPSELEKMETFTLEEGRTILDNIVAFENNAISRNQNLENK